MKDSILYKKLGSKYSAFIKLKGVFIPYVTETVIIEYINSLHQVKCTFLVTEEIKLEYYKNQSKGQKPTLIVNDLSIDLSEYRFYVNNSLKIPNVTIEFETDLIEFE